MLNKVFDVFPEILIGAAIDVIVNADDSFIADVTGIESQWGQLVALALINAGVWLLESLTEWGYTLAWRNLAQTVEHEARMDAYAHVQGLELGYFEDQSTGGLMSVLNDDVNQLERFLDVGASYMIATVVNVLLVGAVFLVASPLLFLVAFLPIPVIVWGSFLYQRRLEPRYRAVREQVGRLSGTLANNLGGIATIKAFTAEDRETARVGAESEAYRQTNRDAIRLSSAFVPLIRIAILIGFTLTLLIGGRLTLDGHLAVGFFSVLVFMTQRLLWPLTRLGETFDLYQRAMASTRRILDLLGVEPTDPGGHAVACPGRSPARSASRTCASPTRAAPTVLRGLDLEVPAGETHAVVGLTGAGKSTIVKLLLRLYEPTGGRVTVDGVDVRDLTFADLRGAIGLVSQDVFLFDGTVRENIAYGDPEASDAQVEEAARARRGPRLHRRPARRLRHPGRRARPEALRRPAPAPLDRAGDRPRPGDPGPRRGDELGGQRDRGGDPAVAGDGLAGADDAGDRPPAEHGPPRRSDPRARGRPRERGGNPRRADRGGWALRRPVAGADGRPRDVSPGRPG